MTFTPSRVAISAISQANPCVVTTSSNHNLLTGQVVRLHVPQNFGMVELNNVQASITVLSNTTFSLQVTQVPPGIDINSTNFTSFTTPSKPGKTAEILPMGSWATPITNTIVQSRNNICDSLTNDSTSNIATTNQPF